VKLRQNGTVFMIKLAALAAGLNSEPQNNEYQISKDESAVRCLFIIDRIHSFDVRCWTFNVRRSSVSFSIRLAALQAGGGTEI
jgi:hypothetical protein